jgi:Uma2 family endonuclease
MSPAPDLRPYQRRITRAEYQAMGKAGLFAEERVELLYGVIVAQGRQGTRNAYSIRKLAALLVPALAGRAEVLVQLPIVAADESEPEPDLTVVPVGDYLDEHPTAPWLVVEVAETSLQKDLQAKAHLYAVSGFPEYWVLDVAAGEVVVHQGPRADGSWQRVVRHGREATLPLPTFTDVQVPLAAILPPPSP